MPLEFLCIQIHQYSGKKIYYKITNDIWILSGLRSVIARILKSADVSSIWSVIFPIYCSIRFILNNDFVLSHRQGVPDSLPYKTSDRANDYVTPCMHALLSTQPSLAPLMSWWISLIFYESFWMEIKLVNLVMMAVTSRIKDIIGDLLRSIVKGNGITLLDKIYSFTTRV